MIYLYIEKKKQFFVQCFLTYNNSLYKHTPNISQLVSVQFHMTTNQERGGMRKEGVKE